jgi:hypothetical protein
MGYFFRVRFTVPGKGSFTSDNEAISFSVPSIQPELKLSSASVGVAIGASERLTVSGGPFDTSKQAQIAAERVRTALLRRSVLMRRGLDVGQLSLKSFGISDYGKQYFAEQLNVPAVQEDHLGVTVYSDNPKPQFFSMSMQGLVSMPASRFVEELVTTVGRYTFRNQRAEIASGIYAFSHFIGRAPARFLVLFVCLEALFDAEPRSEAARNHVQALIEATNASSSLDPEEKQAISSALSFQKSKSIHQTGRALATSALPGKTYRSMSPADFFSHIYKIRNNMVHKGDIDPKEIHDLLGDMDQFISDIILTQYVGPEADGDA